MSAPAEADLRILYAEFTAVPGRADSLADLLAHHAVKVRAEEGCIVFAPHRVEDDPDRFFVYEVYRDDEAFRRHLDAEHSVRFNDRVAESILGGRSVLTQLTGLSGRPPRAGG